MTVFVRAVVTGFGFSLGAALFRKVSDKLGLNDDKKNAERQDAKVAPGAVVNKEAGDDPGRVTPAFS
jgi:hypothetical protein